MCLLYTVNHDNEVYVTLVIPQRNKTIRVYLKTNIRKEVEVKYAIETTN